MRQLALILLICLLPLSDRLLADTVKHADTSQQTESRDDEATALLQAQERFCTDLAHKLRTVRKNACMALDLRPSGFYSVENRPIMARLFPATRPDDQHPTRRILFIGGIHGDEWSAVSLTYLWMQIVQQHTDRSHAWLMIPVVNPDGLFRKPSRRTNAHGVDLNRNFPSPDWHEKAHLWWQKRKRANPRYYPGPAPASEPETRYLLHVIHDWQPDIIIALHAPFNLLDYDGPQQAKPHKIGSLRLRQLGTYPGSLGRYAGEYLHIPVVTLELKSAHRMPSKAEMDAMWHDLHHWLAHVMASVLPALNEAAR